MTSPDTPGRYPPGVILAVVTVAVILVCGAIATLAALPAGKASVPARLAAVFGLGYAMVLWPATVLALVHLLRPWSLALLLAAVSCLLLAWTLRRTPPRELLGGLRGEARAGWPVVVFGLLAVAAIAVARLSIPVDASAGGWRYWSDGLEFADAGSVPSTVLQWGALHAPAISKLGANSFDAGLSFVLRDHPFSAMAAALWISAVGFAAGMFALGWELGLRWCAAALPLLALTGHAWPGGLVFDADIVHKLTFFQTEDSGRMCMLAALVLAVPLLRGDARRRPAQGRRDGRADRRGGADAPCGGDRDRPADGGLRPGRGRPQRPLAGDRPLGHRRGGRRDRGGGDGAGAGRR